MSLQDTALGLRERKKRDKRARILAAARALFGEKVTLPAVVLLDGDRRVQDAAIGGSSQGLARLVEAAAAKE